MERLELSYKTSYQLIKLVKKQYMEDSYGMKSCSDSMEDGDLYDKYLLKSFIDSDFDCECLFNYE